MPSLISEEFLLGGKTAREIHRIAVGAERCERSCRIKHPRTE
jgi:hypothetical protein